MADILPKRLLMFSPYNGPADPALSARKWIGGVYFIFTAAG
jgi:hypothetical protein